MRKTHAYTLNGQEKRRNAQTQRLYSSEAPLARKAFQTLFPMS